MGNNTKITNVFHSQGGILKVAKIVL